MLVTPTPGGSGVAEAIFINYFAEFIPVAGSVVALIAILWRIISYYPYLIIGVIMTPRWIRKKFIEKTKN